MVEERQKKTFKFRGMTTLLVTISFIVDTVSGIILYIAPPGRIAHWTNWTYWGLDKDQWAAIHTIFGYLLLIIVAWHLYYNWRTFIHYLWDKVRKALNLRWELLAATLVSLGVFLGTLWEIPPFSTTMDIGEKAKNSWEQSLQGPPVPHAERMSVKEFSAIIQASTEEILGALKSKGYRVESAEQTMEEIAENNSVSPSVLFQAVTAAGVKPALPTGIEGTGLGKKTIEMICAEKGFSIDETLSRLKDKGVDAEPGDRLKDLANRMGKKPTDILRIIQGEE
jgi:hypothetical protein